MKKTKKKVKKPAPKQREVTYKKNELFTVEEVVYSDGITRYNITHKNEEGFKCSSGMYNDIDLLIEILERIGKISTPRVYVSK